MGTCLVVSNYNDARRSLDVILQGVKTQLFDYYVLVENGSTDDSYDFITENKPEWLIVLRNIENRGYSVGHNTGLRYAAEVLKADYIFTASSDLVITEKCIKRCLEEHEKRENVGVISCRIMSPRGEERSCAWKTPRYIDCFLYCFPFLRTVANRPYDINPKEQNFMLVDTVRGSFHSFKREAIIKAGYFDENVFLYNEENILSERMKRAGYLEGLVTDAFYMHNHIRVETKRKVSFSERRKNEESGIYYLKEYRGTSPFLLGMLRVAVLFRCLYLTLAPKIKRFIKGKH